MIENDENAQTHRETNIIRQTRISHSEKKLARLWLAFDFVVINTTDDRFQPSYVVRSHQMTTPAV